MGFALMVGCMISTSLAIAPALLVAQRARVVDLDGALCSRATQQWRTLRGQRRASDLARAVGIGYPRNDEIGRRSPQ